MLSMLKWLRRRREARRRVVEDAKRLRKPADQSEQPSDRLCQSNGRVVCAWRSTPRPKRPLGRESAPLGQCAGSSLFVDLASDEMALLIEVVMDLGMN
jgi:hypothetical protein